MKIKKTPNLSEFNTTEKHLFQRTFKVPPNISYNIYLESSKKIFANFKSKPLQLKISNWVFWMSNAW